MKTKCIYVLFLFVSICHLRGQYVVQGQIVSNEGNVLVDATIICRSRENKIVSYTISDSGGSYQLKIPAEGSYFLEFSSLGFDKKLIPIQFDNTAYETINLDVILDKNYMVLDEVILAENRPILIKKDTVVFDAKYFKRGNEQDIEDLLKNIPNINVDTDGTIRVGNTEIEKVMIEGDDFFKKGYKMITRNMPSDPIDKVEIIKNYSENPLLSGINESKKIALNLKLDKASKSIWFGNIEVGYGASSESRYDISSILMNFSKRYKYYFLGDLNNIGQDSKGNLDQLIAPLDLERPSYIGDGERAFNLFNLNAAPLNFKKERSNFNNSELVSLNAIFRPKPSLKITTNGFLNWDENQFFRNNSTFVNVIGSSFNNTEIYTLNKTNNTQFTKLDATYNISETELLETSFSYLNKNTSDNSDLLFNSVSTFENLDASGTLFNSMVNYSNRFKKDNVFLLTARYIYEDTPQDYSINQFYYSELFPQFTDANNVAQQSKNHMKFTGIAGHILKKTKEGNLWHIQFGNAHRMDQLWSTFSLKEDDLVLEQPEGYQNNLEFITNDIYLNSKYTHKLDKLLFTGELSFHQIFNKIITDTNKEYQKPVFINPTIGLEWSPDTVHTFTMVYSYNTTKASVIDAFSNFALTGFRSFYRGTGDFNQINASTFLFTYQLGNWSDKFFAAANVLHVKNHDFFSSNSIVNQNFNLSERIIIDDRELFNVSSNLDYFIRGISSNIKLDLGLSRINYMNIVNNSELREINSLNYNYGVQLRSGFSGKLNFHLGTKWIENRIITSFTNTFTDNVSFADVSFIFSNQLNLDMQTERYLFGNLEQENNTYYFLDLNMRYAMSKKFNLTLTVNNLFNTKRFRMYSISDLGNSITEYRLLPRYLLLKLKYRFGLK